MKARFLRHFFVGCVIGMLILPPTTAQAQWPVIDASQYALQVKKRIEEATRWIQTVQHYTEIYTKAVEQLTTLRGVLKTVDTELFKNQQAALLANDIATIISDSQKLKRQLEGLVHYQIRFLRSIDDRLEQGIFNPDADMRDLQNYLLYTMGRDARQTVDQMMRYARADAQLAAWIDERDKLRIEYATTNAKLVATRKKLPQGPIPPEDLINVQHLNDTIAQLEKKADDIKKRLDELTSKIAERIKAYGLRLQDMENFARKIDANSQMWVEMTKTQANMQKTMNDLFFNTPQYTQ